MDFCSIQRIIMYYCHSFFSAQITQDLASESLHADSYVPLMYPHYSLSNFFLAQEDISELSSTFPVPWFQRNS